MKRMCIGIIIGLLFSHIATSQVATEAVMDRDYAVYSIVINTFSQCVDMEYINWRGGVVLINKTTKSVELDQVQQLEEHFFRRIRRMIYPPENSFYKDPAWAYFLASITSAQFAPHTLNRLPSLACRKAGWWTSELENYYFGKDGWQNFGYKALRQDYPGFYAIVELSKVAYSLDGSKAICYFSETQGELAGAGYAVYLERKQNGWRIVSSKMLWIS